MDPTRPGVLRLRPSVALLALLALTAACGESDAGSRTVRADSAGVEIVESSAPAWSDEAGPRVDPEPRVRIDNMDGPDGTQLFDVRFATVLSDGRIVVGNGGSGELRYFGADGGFERAAGGQGEGPGEFEFMYPVFSRLPGDTLRLFDGATRRITEYTGAGELVRSRTLDPPDLGSYGAFFAGTFRDGRMAASTMVLPAMDGAADGEMIGGERTYWALESVDGAAVEVARVREPERLVRVVDGTPRVVALPFRFSEQAVPHVDLVVAATDRHEVRWYSPDGGLRRVARWAGELRPLDESGFEAWLDGLPYPQERVDGIRSRYEGLPLPPHVPTVRGVLVDPAGNVWLEPYRLVPTEPNRWTVIGADGAWLGPVDLPAGLEPYEIGDDWLIGLWRDELDVSYVHVHDLRRAP